MIVTGYVRDERTGMVINTQREEYERVLLTRARRKRERDLEKDLDSVKTEVKEIKDLLTRVLRALEDR